MYHDPKTVLSPKDRVSSVEVVFDKGPVESSWSVARLRWEVRLPSASDGTAIAVITRALLSRGETLRGLLFLMNSRKPF